MDKDSTKLTHRIKTLDARYKELPRLLEVDDMLVDAVKKKLMSFIKQKLNITK